jgi:hypothetical protein
VVHESTRAFFDDRVFGASCTVFPDELVAHPRAADIKTVPALGTLRLDDPTNPVEVYAINSGHADDMVIAYLPNQRALFNSDLYIPLPDELRRASLVPYFTAKDFRDLAAGIQHHGLTPAVIVGGHGGATSIDVFNADHEGFRETIPTGATEITSVGQKVHHQEQVLDHMETEHYTEQVPDGYRSESYTEQVSCGQDCTTTPKSCHEECTSKKNGFASCKQVCSGGGRSCKTRYCSESRTRQVPKTRTEYRTRQVPRYRSEPRYAEAFHYKTWDWAADRTVRAAGVEATGVHWPDSGARTTGLPAGEQEREQRHARYTITLHYHGDETVRFAVPTPEALAPFTTHSQHVVRRVSKAVFVDGAPITPLTGP